ncbi:MAG: cobalamin B12-binding domain-containing protein [Desulfococcaceae bacterium]|jgi:methylmalonyl-CoA mutase cobalamin-binding subunit|nr:cobalamin B12-binding domain-containing protein [Desulfococcaceae bacterium]
MDKSENAIPAQQLRSEISKMLDRLRGNSHPSRTLFTEEARNLLRWREHHGIPGLWDNPPLMLTATLDDGWGHGLEVIRLCAEAAGMRVRHLGLLRSADAVIRACCEHHPHILGMTVLQFDSEEELAQIRRKIPPETRIIAGGPLFHADPEFAARSGIDIVAKDAADFLHFLLHDRTMV